MDAKQTQHALEQMFALQPWYFEDAENVEARLELSTPAYWASLVPGASACPTELAARLAAAGTARAPRGGGGGNARAAIDAAGFFVAPATLRSAALCAELWRIAAALARAALPPHFVFVYNAAWELLEEQMATVAADVLGEGPLVLEADMACWALKREAPAGAPDASAPYVGAAFSSSHRDQTYSACHDGCGVPTSLNVWVPFNPSGARADNGAMRVLPAPDDAFFFSPEHPLHMDTAAALAGGAPPAAAVLECAAGAACAWVPCAVHWGGVCAAGAAGEPRASVAATFRRADAPRSAFGAGGGAPLAGAAGPPPLERTALDALPLARRLAYVAKGLLAYSHWTPGFPGVSLAAGGDGHAAGAWPQHGP